MCRVGPRVLGASGGVSAQPSAQAQNAPRFAPRAQKQRTDGYSFVALRESRLAMKGSRMNRISVPIRSLTFLITAAATLAHPAQAAGTAFDTYGLSYHAISPPPVGSGSFSVVGDALPDGRLIAVTGNQLFLESAVGSGAFNAVATFDPAQTAGSVDPSFVDVSPDGSHIAVGTGFSKPVAVFPTSALGSPGAPAPLTEGSVANYFSVSHFDAAWADNTRLAITAGTFGQPSQVTLLDITSPTSNPSNTVIIDNIQGSSAGIAFDANGNLYTGNGFDGATGGSGTGWIKAFDSSVWASPQSSTTVDFESDGTFIADVLSASALNFDMQGNLFVGGGDFGTEFDAGYLAVLNGIAIDSALVGGPALDRSDPSVVRRLDPRNDSFGFFSSIYNDATGELVVLDFSTWYATIPAPASSLCLLSLGLTYTRRSRHA